MNRYEEAKACYEEGLKYDANNKQILNGIADCKKHLTGKFWAEIIETNAAFRLACRSPNCRFDGDFCTTAQAPLAAEGRPSGKQHLANISIAPWLCPQWQTAGRSMRAMSLGDKA